MSKYILLFVNDDGLQYATNPISDSQLPMAVSEFGNRLFPDDDAKFVFDQAECLELMESFDVNPIGDSVEAVITNKDRDNFWGVIYSVPVHLS